MCTLLTENEMQEAGISDIKVTYQKCSKNYFADNFGLDEDEEVDYYYYYVLDYYSDSIDTIYKQKTQGGDFQPFIDVMNNVRCVEMNRDDGYEGCHRLKMGDRIIDIFIEDLIDDLNLTIKKDVDQTYRLYINGVGTWIYVNEDEVYEKKTVNNRSYSNKSYRGNSSSKKTDPYDVYDYDDPDEFADEWGEEFGDGNYDDAYDYWEDESED